MILECKRCEALVNAEFIAGYIDGNESLPTTYSLLKCPKCEHPFLTFRDKFEEFKNRRDARVST